MKLAVVGSGVSGIFLSHLLAQSGYGVTLIESAPELGGVLSGASWGNYTLDKGCHLFEPNDDSLVSLVDALAPGLMQKVPVKLASYLGGMLHGGSGQHSFKYLEGSEKERIKEEILYNVTLALPGAKEESVETYILNKYGRTLSCHLRKSLEKQLQIQVSEAEQSFVIGTHLRRVFVFENQIARELKRNTFLDEILAAEMLSQEKNSLFVYYPRHGGTRAFVDCAKVTLENQGVIIRSNTRVERVCFANDEFELLDQDGNKEQVSKVIWTSEIGHLEKLLFGENRISQHLHKVPMVLYYISVNADQISDYNFINDFEPHHYTSRVSAPGVYGNQVFNGKTYVCCEVPQEVGSPLWNDPEAYKEEIWQEALEVGMLVGSSPSSSEDWKIVKAPTSYTVSKLGYEKRYQELQLKLSIEYPGVMAFPGGTFFKTDIASFVSNVVANMK